MSKPIIKWAGGKSQLVSIIDAHLPEKLKRREVTTYIEPFIGGGALFFYLAEKYKFNRSILIDVNPELILLYTVIQKDVEELIAHLDKMEKCYLSKKPAEREIMFYDVRIQFNKDVHTTNFSKYSFKWVERAALFIFLNKTCFNGLFRVNKKAEFNVPFGKYKNPTILDKERLRETSKILQTATLICGSYNQCEPFVDDKSFIYMDPPYRPLNASSSFTSYSKYDFNDDEQIALAKFYAKLSKMGAYLMLSNSDPKNTNGDDCFFDDLYRGFNIKRVAANRMINSNATKRGKITELLITNYTPPSPPPESGFLNVF